MLIAPLPSNEDLRLLDLASYDIMDTEAEQDFDDLVELAGSICNCPISLISLLDRDRQWFKAKTGVDETETPRDVAFCAHAILQDGTMVVNDAKEDIRFTDNPFVTGEHKVRFYAGAPIISPAGQKLGTICVIDRVPKELNDFQLKALSIISNQITKLLELRVKNRIIQERATELIAIKNTTVDHVLSQSEQQKKYIANELHENLAQGLAATRLYIGMAEENEKMRMPLLKKAKQHLGDIMSDMRRLSNSILPSTLHTMPLQDMLKDFVSELSSKVSFKVHLVIAGEVTINGNEENLAYFRVIENWLSLLKPREDIDNVIITLKAGNKISLTIEDDGDPQTAAVLEKEIITGMIDRQIDRLGGAVSFSPTGSKGNVLYVSFPDMGEQLSA